eukprot:jgi/Mesvir1/2529/Mv08668-RA.1
MLACSGQRSAQPGHFRVDMVERGPEGQRITKELPLGSKDYMALAFPVIHSEGNGGWSYGYDEKSGKRKQEVKLQEEIKCRMFSEWRLKYKGALGQVYPLHGCSMKENQTITFLRAKQREKNQRRIATWRS